MTQLGPGFLRRPPRGWVTGQVSAVSHRAWQPGNSGVDGGQSEIDTACVLNARWRVELPGREPYEHLFGPRAAKHYKPGRKVSAWIDPADPDAICPGR